MKETLTIAEFTELEQDIYNYAVSVINNKGHIKAENLLVKSTTTTKVLPGFCRGKISSLRFVEVAKIAIENHKQVNNL